MLVSFDCVHVPFLPFFSPAAKQIGHKIVSAVVVVLIYMCTHWFRC